MRFGMAFANELIEDSAARFSMKDDLVLEKSTSATSEDRLELPAGSSTS